MLLKRWLVEVVGRVQCVLCYGGLSSQSQDVEASTLRIDYVLISLKSWTPQ